KKIHKSFKQVGHSHKVEKLTSNAIEYNYNKTNNDNNPFRPAIFSSCIKIDTLGLNGVYVSITNCAYVYCSYVRNHAVIGRQIISYEIL
ncbi:hypothetical protein T06_4651, partial [Trichinella sp. T6]